MNTFNEKAQAPTDELNTSAEKVSMSGGHVNKTADSLHVHTDDEREDMIAWLMRDQGDDLSPLGRDYTDAEIADMLRLPAQTEPTDEQIEVIADSIESFFEEHVHMARRLYPDVWKRDLALVVLKAAFATGQEDKP